MTKIILPRCNWCGVSGAYKCKSCNQFTCHDCLVEINKANRCLHRKYEPVTDTGWDSDNLLLG